MSAVRNLLLSCALACALSLPATAQVHSARVPFSYDAPELDAVGRLEWRGGLELSADADWFGGLSALDIDEAGTTLTAIADSGRWLRFGLGYDARGYLAAARLTATGQLRDVGGQPFRRRGDRDSESLARLADGSYVVSFEIRHRLLHYPAATPPFSTPPRWLTPPPGVYAAPANGGIEALASFDANRLFALTESLRLEDGTNLGWLGDGRQWMPVRYRPASGYQPTGAARLPDGDIAILERKLTMLGGFAARIARLPAGDILDAAKDARRVLEGEEIARLQAPVNVDNFEGIAARRTADGETLIYLVSDDNFFALQRTLLFAFALRESNPPAPPG